MKIKTKMQTVNPKSFIHDYLKACGVNSPIRYLSANKTNIENPEHYMNIIEACSVIHNGIASKMTFGLLVDCDLDGYASSAIAYQFLISQGITPIIYHHTAKQHGLHTNEALVGRIISDGVGVMWIPDAGTNDVDECATLAGYGVKVIITDHHNIEIENPYGIIVNNTMGQVGNRALSGAGVTAKVVEQYCKMYNIEQQNYADLVAVSLVSDSCDMTEIENRTIYNMVFGGEVRE